MLKSCLTTLAVLVGILFAVARGDSLDELRSRLDNLTSTQDELAQKMNKLRFTHNHDVSNMTRMCQGLSDRVEEQAQLLQTLQTLHQSLNNNNNNNNNASSAGNDDRSDDACAGGYRVIDDDRRSSRDSYSSYDEICDNLLDEAWYRFMLNGENAEMPTACVEEKRCQTDAPVWLDLQGEAMPEVGHQVKGRGCAHWVGDCCNWETEVTVRNCGDFLIYHLSPTPVCELAYCAQPQGSQGYFP